MLDKFFHDKNIIADILEEIEKENNLKIIDIIKNIYKDILADSDILELKKNYQNDYSTITVICYEIISICKVYIIFFVLA